MRDTRRVLLALAMLLPCTLLAQASSTSSVSRDLERLATDEQIRNLPSADSVSAGPRTIAAGATVHGAVVARGPVDVLGTVEGTVVSLSGDVIVHRGGVVRGDAISVGGHVIADSGRVEGEMRGMSALPILPGVLQTGSARSATQRTIDAVRLVGSVFGVLLLVGCGVLLFADRNLDEVVGTLEHRFGRVFWVGLLGQLLLLPVLVLLVIVLAVSVVGILLIPFAMVAYAIAAAGIITLGFLAVARLIGGALWQPASGAARTRALGALVAGVGIFCVLWMIAALLTWAPVAASVVRTAAFAATWASLTLGLGAAILSRAGTHRRISSGNRPVELATWQTPTPISGVIAARRPMPVVKENR